MDKRLRPDISSDYWEEWSNQATHAAETDQWVLYMIPYEGYLYLVVKSSVKREGVDIITCDADTVYPIDLMRYCVRIIKKSKQSIITDVDGHAEGVRNALLGLGFIENEDVYILEK